MKKLILASAIAALTANAASAATIYDDKGLTFKIKGDWQIQLRDGSADNDDTDIEFDDLEIKNSVVYDLGNGVKAFGQVDFSFNDAANGSASNSGNLEEAYLGFAFDNVSILFGETDNATDEFNFEQAYEQVSESIFDGTSATGGDDVIKLNAEFGAVTLVASHELESQGNGSADGENTELFVGGDIGAVSLAAAYQTRKDTPSDESQDIWGLSAAFDAGFADFRVAYGESDGSTAENAEQLDLITSFKVAKTTKVAIGYINLDFDDAGQQDREQTYANITYKFPAQKNVSVFAEISDIDRGPTNDGTDVLAGVRLKF